MRNLLGGSRSKRGSAHAAAADKESVDATVSPDFGDDVNASGAAAAAAAAAAEFAPKPPKVSIRNDKRFHKHVAKKQGHSMTRSAHGSSGSHQREPLPTSLHSRSESAEAVSSSPAAAPVQPPPSHALKQGHCMALSVANVTVHSSTHDILEELDSGASECGGGGGGPQQEQKSQPRRSIVTINGTIEEEEMFARDHAESRPLALFFWNGLSSVIVFVRYLVSIDSVLSLVLSCGLTFLCWERTKDDEHFDGTMSFVLLGFAVLMPLSVSVRITFARRENALENIASLQTHAHSIYLCHACWDWGKAPGGRSEDPGRWLRHSDEVLRVLVAIGDELTRFLTLPNSSFSRHRETIPGRREAAVTISASYRIFGDVIQRRITRLSTLLEEMKLAGFSASEASRVRQYEMLLTQAVQNLRMFKMYRSPKALNALLNVTTTLLPPFYAPAFAQIAHDSGSLAVAMAFAAITSLALSALYESVQVLEDPFVAFLTLDGIDVYEELAVLYYHQFIETRREIFPTAHEFHEVAEEKDTLSDIFDGNCANDIQSDLLDRRAMMMRGRSSRASSKVLVDSHRSGMDDQSDRRSMMMLWQNQRVCSKNLVNDRRAGMSSMNRQSIFQLDIPSFDEDRPRNNSVASRSPSRRGSSLSRRSNS